MHRNKKNSSEIVSRSFYAFIDMRLSLKIEKKNVFEFFDYVIVIFKTFPQVFYPPYGSLFLCN